MNIPLEWLREYINIDLPSSKIASLLTSIGFAVDAIEEIEGEEVFQVDITTNRPDCMNIFGMARELAAATGAKLIPPPMTYREGNVRISDLGRVIIENESLCPRYCGKIIMGLQVAPSPSWLVKRIKQVGLRPINNIVDLSNYVLFELGHPLHIFDFDKIQGKTLIVRKARLGEKLTTIDSAERRLTEEMLVIADEKDPMAIAGIMGGSDSEVSPQTKNIFIESAFFQPHSIRRTSKKLGLSTEASFRFERGADPNMTLRAIDRVTHLIQKCSICQISSGHIDLHQEEFPEKEIPLRMNRMEKILGVNVSQSQAERILTSLEMKVQRETKGILKVAIPSFRVDCHREIDLIEEVARFIRYDSLPGTIPYATDQKVKGTPDQREEVVASLLISAGYSESINYSMVSRKDQEHFSFWKETTPLIIDNPLSERAAVLRTSLLSGLLHNVLFNYSRGLKDIKLFEIGKVYRKASRSPSEEKKHLAFIATGHEGPRHWKRERRALDLWDIKGAAETILKNLGQPHFHSELLKEEHFFRKDQAFQLISSEGQRWAVGGEINPDLIQDYKIHQPVFAAEVAIGELPAIQEKIQWTPTSLLPIVSRDLSILVDNDIRFDDVRKILEEKWQKNYVEMVLANRYEGPPIPKGKMSLTFHIVIHQKDHTLSNEEINGLLEEILHLLSKEMRAELRTE